MNITQEQPKARPTFPTSYKWMCNGVEHRLGGMCMENAEFYTKVVQENSESQILSAIQIADVMKTLVHNIANVWDCPETDVSAILSGFLAWAKETNSEFKKVYADELRKRCKRTRAGADLADELMQMC